MVESKQIIGSRDIVFRCKRPIIMARVWWQKMLVYLLKKVGLLLRTVMWWMDVFLEFLFPWNKESLNFISWPHIIIIYLEFSIFVIRLMTTYDVGDLAFNQKVEFLSSQQINFIYHLLLCFSSTSLTVFIWGIISVHMRSMPYLTTGLISRSKPNLIIILKW